MSTRFAVKIIKDGETHFPIIAFRHNGGRMEILNDLIYILNKKRKVYPLDNTPQGIFNIGDILKEIKE
jgi:hypothetical protein